MSNSTPFCVFCKETTSNLKIFNENILRNCSGIWMVRKKYKLAQHDTVLPSQIENFQMCYHTECYRRFTALPPKYRKLTASKDASSSTLPSSHNLCEENKSSICCGCLSVDRHVKPLSEFVDVFASLLGDQINDIKLFNMELCWECMALLKRIKIFQNKIKKACYLLGTLHKMGALTVRSLSTLSTVKQDLCEVVIQHDSEELTNIKDDSDEIKEIKDDYEAYYLDDCYDQYDENEHTEERELVENSIGHKFQDDNIKFEVEIDNLKAHQNQLDADQHYLIVIDNKKRNDKNAYKFRNKHKNETIPNIPANEIISCEDFRTMEMWNKKDIKKIEYNLDSLCDATIVKTDIDINDVTNVVKYYTEVKMNKEEFEEALEKRKQGLDFISMKFKCEPCARGFTFASYLKNHQRLFHTKVKVPFECSVCKCKISTRYAMFTHMATQHRTLRCTACGYMCWGRSMPVTHLRAHLFTYTCNFCSEQFNSIDSFACHRTAAHRDFICDVCGQNVKSKSYMVKHLRKHLSQPIECEECGKCFGKLRSYRNHVELVHTVAEQDREACYCVECGVQFPNMRKYKHHLANSVKHAAGTRRRETIACVECGKMVTRKYMKNHFKLYHLKKNDHYCEICDKYFVTNYSVRNHRMYVHDKEVKPRDKVCNLCGQAFHTNRILNNHIRTHTGEKPFACKYCGVSFAQKTAMTTHERRHKKHSS